MDSEEFAALLQHVRRTVSSRGLGELDQLLVRSRLTDIPTSQGQLLAYLDGLRNEISLGTEQTMRQTMQRLRQIRTDDGRPVEGVTIDVTDDDFPAYGARTIDLVGSPGLDALLAELDELIARVRQSGDQ
jgi:hypothetical protein